jgi:ABC-type multidrug transport system fused ATPase/permease subunit
MFLTFRKVLSLLSRKERGELAWIMLAMLVMATFEVLGIASIMPFMALVANPDSVHSNHYLAAAYAFTGLQSVESFLLVVGIAVLGFLVLSNAVSALTLWRMLNFTNMRMHTLSERLLVKYLSQPYVFFLNRNSSELLKNVLPEVSRVIGGILIPGIQALSRLVVVFFIVGLLLAVDPLLAISVLLVLGLAYGTIYWSVRRRLAAIGKASFEASTRRYQFASEALSGIKDIKLFGREAAFVSRFSVPSRLAAYYEAQGQVMSSLPRYALEVVAFGGIVMIVLYLLATKGGIEQVLPLVALYAFAGYRLMPAMQQIFFATTQIRFHAPALDQLCRDLDGAPTESVPQASRPTPVPMRVDDSIELRSVRFAYPGSQKPVLRNLNLRIGARTTVGLVGMTGAGKTTIADIVLGILHPDSGALLVDGNPISPENVGQWRANVGHVPQSIYISDDTVAGNIAFGVPAGSIDMARVERAAKAANLHEFVATNLPDEYMTLVGERGVRLSGGQRQRIGIARALYNDPGVLVLDEATSALDGITENVVMEALHHFSHDRTIIVIAHRVTTLRACDMIYMMVAGDIAVSGTYEELLRSNQNFRAMANVA